MISFLPLIAFIIDWNFADPDILYRRIPHPVVLIGKVIEKLETRWNSRGDKPKQDLVLGGLTALSVCVLVGFVGWLLQYCLSGHWIGVLVLVAMAWTFLAFGSLALYVQAVKSGLDVNGVEGGREAVAHIVGRDLREADEASISRAAIESLAENFSDAVVAPLFWLLVGGLPGLMIYKAINTLDSMIGHRNERYLYFGRVAARVDDVANWVPARLSTVIIAAANRSMSPLIASLKEAHKHRSPNAGWPEAAFAQALGIKLSGPRVYDGVLGDEPWIGTGRADLTAGDIEQAIKLYYTCGIVILITLLVIALMDWQPLA